MTMCVFSKKISFLTKKRDFSYRKTTRKIGYLLRLYTETFYSFVFIQKGLIIFRRVKIYRALRKGIRND